MSESELTQIQLVRLAQAEAITRGQLDIAKAIVAEHYDGWPDALTTPLVGALVAAMASNYIAVGQASQGG